MIKVYIDENISPYLAEGLYILEKPVGDDFEVLSIAKIFGQGAKDEDWIPKVGAENGIVITQDLNIHRVRRQRELYQHHNVGIFFLSPPKKNGIRYWDMVLLLINRWQEIKQKATTERPFAFRSTPSRPGFEQLT